MANNIAVFIAVEPEHGRPVALARLSDAGILRIAALAAIETAKGRAAEAERRDVLLGEICTAEARHLEEYLHRYVPGLNSGPTSVQ